MTHARAQRVRVTRAPSLAGNDTDNYIATLTLCPSISTCFLVSCAGEIERPATSVGAAIGLAAVIGYVAIWGSRRKIGTYASIIRKANLRSASESLLYLRAGNAKVATFRVAVVNLTRTIQEAIRS